MIATLQADNKPDFNSKRLLMIEPGTVIKYIDELTNNIIDMK
jgi:hypothetical protein